MIHSTQHTYLFHMGRKAYIKIGLLSWLLCGAFLVCGVVCAILAVRLFPTYNHAFTLFLKWQDGLVALCWCTTLIALVGCALIVRFSYALYAGYHKEMLILSEDAIIVRDLSPENLSSIFWLMSTSLLCSLVALVGLVPEMLLGWTLHLASPLWAVLGTIVLFVLSIAGLLLTLPAILFVIVGLAGSISFSKKMGSLHVYRLTNQASLSIEDFVLTIIYPDAPESMIDLTILSPDDQRQLLHLLHEHWNATERLWNPRLGAEIEAALAEQSEHAKMIYSL